MITPERGFDMRLQVYFDGSFRNPNGTAAYGFIVYDEDRKVVHSASGRAGRGKDMSGNVAEYEGLYQAMKYIEKHYPEAQVLFNGDSTLVISQMRGEARARTGKYLPYHEKTLKLAAPFIKGKLWRFNWVQRALNSAADELAQYQRY